MQSQFGVKKRLTVGGVIIFNSTHSQSSKSENLVCSLYSFTCVVIVSTLLETKNTSGVIVKSTKLTLLMSRIFPSWYISVPGLKTFR